MHTWNGRGILRRPPTAACGRRREGGEGKAEECSAVQSGLCSLCLPLDALVLTPKAVAY